MEELQYEQEQNVMLSIRVPKILMDSIDEIKWRDRKTRTRVIVEFLQNAVNENLNNDFINSSKKE